MRFSDHLTSLVSVLLNHPSLMLVILAAAQLMAFFYLWRKCRQFPRARLGLIALFIGANLCWGLTVNEVYLDPALPNPDLLALIYRPAQSWQLLCFLCLAGYLAVRGLKGVTKLIAYPFVVYMGSRKKPSGNFRLNRERRNFLIKGGTALSLAGGLSLTGLWSGSAYGLYRQTRRPEVVAATLLYPDLPPSLDGFKIVQLTDPHLGLLTSLREVEEAFALAAELGPDLAVVTGDWVDREAAYAKLYRQPVDRLLQVTPWGVWGVLGNHDHYVNASAVTGHLRDLGVSLLSDQTGDLSRFDLPLLIVGLEDPGTRTNWLSGQDYDLGLSGFQNVLLTRPHCFKLLLFHRPTGLDQAARAGFHLFLAGHTHGGQYGFAQANLAALSQKYTVGWYRKGGCHLNVSRGLASVGLPFRLGSWPSIELITLKRA